MHIFPLAFMAFLGSGETAGGSSSSRDTDGSPKEAALLKAAMESLRAGLREKEDAVTELVRQLPAAGGRAIIPFTYQIRTSSA